LLSVTKWYPVALWRGVLKIKENCFYIAYNTDKQAASFNSYLSAIKYRLNLYNYFFRNLQMKSLIVMRN
jgi:hypothetical protein